MSALWGHLYHYLLFAMSIVLGFLLWAAVASQLPPVVFPSPLPVLKELFEGLFVTGTISRGLVYSMGDMVTGFALALCLAVPLGFLMSRVNVVFQFLNPTLSLLFAIPPIAFAPFIIVWFGLGFEARVALITLMSFFEILYTIIGGVRTISEGYVDVARSFSADRMTVFAKVLVPASLPILFTAFRFGLVRAIHAMITAELLIAAAHLGKVMQNESDAFDTAGILAIVLLLALIGLFCQEAIKWLEKKTLPWHFRPES